MAITVDQSRCPQNHRCPSVPVCKLGALAQDGHGAPTVDEDKCTECGACVKSCPRGALRPR